MSETDIVSKVEALRRAGLKRDGAASDPVNRLAAKINAAQDKHSVVTVRIKVTRGFLDAIDWHASMARYSRGGFIKLAITLLLEALGAQIEDVEVENGKAAE
jgi:hypothetical protein